MGSEYIGPLPDPDKQPPVPRKIQFVAPKNEPAHDSGEDTQPRPAVRPDRSPASQEDAQEPSYREHVSGQLFVVPSDAPYFRQAYQPYGQRAPQPPQPPQPYGQVPQASPPTQGPQGAQPYQSYGPPQAAQQQAPQAPGMHPAYPGRPPSVPPQPQAYPAYPPAHGYYGYMPQQGGYPGYYPYPQYPYYPYYSSPPYAYGWYPPQPKRDGYLLGVSIAAFIGSIFAVLGGMISAGLLLLLTMVPTTSERLASQQFSGMILLTALALAGLGGGSFSLYHSIRSLFLKKPSIPFKLPWFGIFLALYILVVAAGFLVSGNQRIAVNSPVTILLIVLSGILPALIILSLAVRRVRAKGAAWSTSWRRFTLAIVSGATSAVLLATIFEFVLEIIASTGLHINALSIDNPDMQMPHNGQLLLFLFLLVSVIAPLVEETVKPLAAVVLVGRMRSAAEAFVLGLSCGIGFDIIETLGYISQGYHQWLNTAIERSAAGLLHGFGAGMVTLGWYYLTHRNSARHRILLGLGCGLYAILQHAIWNGSFGLQLLPAPIGPFLDSGTIAIGSYSMPGLMIVYIVETILMLVFFLFVTGKLRGKNATPDTGPGELQAQSVSRVPAPARV